MAALAVVPGGATPGHRVLPTSPPAVRAPLPAARSPHFSKVAVVFLENRSYHEIIGNPAAPYLNRLARNYALETHYFAVAHPSLPNYLALLTGSTLGVRKDCNSCDYNAVTLPNQLTGAGIPWKAYFEGSPSPGFEGRKAGDYTKHYNPFAYSERITDSSVNENVRSFGALHSALRNADLPRFSWIAPDLLHDGHNGSVRASDSFAAGLVPRVLRALGPRGVLFLTWDEAHGRTGPAGGRVAMVAAGGGVRRHALMTRRVTHYSLLATLEAGLGLPRLGHSGDPQTPLLTPLLKPSLTTS
jgi:hypothetical protein